MSRYIAKVAQDEDKDGKIAATKDVLAELGRQKGFQVETDKDYGAGVIHVVWRIQIHSSLRDIACGFIFVNTPSKTIGEAAEKGEIRNREDFENQQSWEEYREKERVFIKDIEEAAMRGIRSGLDKVYLVGENEETTKAISGKIEWLASHGSLLRLDAISLGLSIDQKSSSVIVPSQKRVPKGAKIRKRVMRQREAKFEKYNRPKGEKRRKEPKERTRERKEKLDKFSRPKSQRKETKRHKPRHIYSKT